jgi:hypothetical protein
VAGGVHARGKGLRLPARRSAPHVAIVAAPLAEASAAPISRPSPPISFPPQEALAFQAGAPRAHAPFAEWLVSEALALSKRLAAPPPAPGAPPPDAGELPALRAQWEGIVRCLRPLALSPEAMMARTALPPPGGDACDAAAASAAPLPPVAGGGDGRWERVLKIFARAEEIWKAGRSEAARALMASISDHVYGQAYDYTGAYAFGGGYAPVGGFARMPTVPPATALRGRGGGAHEPYLDALAARGAGRTRLRQVVATRPTKPWWVPARGGRPPCALTTAQAPLGAAAAGARRHPRRCQHLTCTYPPQHLSFDPPPAPAPAPAPCPQERVP